MSRPMGEVGGEIWVVGGTALTMDANSTVIEKSAIHLSGGKIAWLGTEANAKIPAGAKKIDTSKCIVTPGFTNGHTHTGMTLLRGLANDLPLEKWLNDYILPMERKWAVPEFVYTGNLLAACELIRSGVTNFADMYYFQEHAAKAMHQAGLRMQAGAAVGQISQSQDATAILAELDEFRDAISGYPLITASVAPHSQYGLDESLWERLVEYSQKHDLLVQTHVSESMDDESSAQKKFGMSSVQFFEKIGLWKCKALAAHCVELSSEDIAILGKNAVGVAYNPESNMKLGNRICPVVELRKAGAHVCVGTDGAVSNNNLNILQEADFGLKLQTLRYGPAALTARDMVRMLTSEAAAALCVEDEVGTLEVGKCADLVAIDTWLPHMQPVYDPYGQIAYSASGRDVRHSIVNGRVLMENYQIKTLDEQAILQLAYEWGAKVRSSR